MPQQLGQPAAIVGRINNERATQRAWPNVGDASLKGEGLRSHGDECSNVKWCFVSFLCLSHSFLAWIAALGPIHGEGLGSTPERWRKLLLERSTWPAVEAYFANSDLVVLGFGSTENHGRHNPLGTDWMAPQRIVDLMDERRPEVLYGPTLRLGSADHFIDYPGTLSLGDDLLHQVVARICGQLYHYGARHFCFVNGHGGNTRALTMTGYELNDRGCQVALLNWWKLAGELNPAWGGGHGGAQETSANLWIDPTTVDTAAFGPMDLVDDGGSDIQTQGFDVVEFEGVHPSLIRRARRYATNGWIGKDDPKQASAEWGEQMLTAFADWAVEFLDTFAQSPLPDRIER